MKTLFTFCGTICMLAAALSLNGQGCSDAGFCTLNSFKPNTNRDTSIHPNQLKAGVSAGRADKSVSVLGAYVEYVRQLAKIELSAKVATLAQNGHGISTFGLSDVYLNAGYKPNKKTKLTIGAKIPLSDGNKLKNNLPLPMNYQSSLGTFDLILGLGYEIKRWQLVAGLQQPLTQNKNGFLSDREPMNSPLKQFQSTNQFIRSGDVLLRVSYPLHPKSKLKVTPSLLPIYHLHNDKFTNLSGEQQEIQGSQGLTFNVNAYLDYELNRKNSVQLNIGAPIIVRDSKPEGLNRSFVANVEYRVTF